MNLSQRRREFVFLFFFFVLFVCFVVSLQAQYTVDVQVVDLQVSVSDSNGDFITDLRPDDFLVLEDDMPQEVLDLELIRQPFSIGILLDTSASMQSRFSMALRGAEDFIYSLRPEDEYFLMTFDDRLLLKKDFGLAQRRTSLKLDDLRYGEGTRLYDGVISALERLQGARYPRRALFLISDGLNTMGNGDIGKAIELAQKQKVLIYGLMFENNEPGLNTVRMLSEATGASYFIVYGDFPRLQAAYDRIAADLAHRFTLYYRSRSDYSKSRKPKIKLEVKNRQWRVRFQKTYYP